MNVHTPTDRASWVMAFCVATIASMTHATDCQSVWSPLDSGVTGGNPLVLALAEFDDGSGSGPALYAGGGFASAGDVLANHFARWDGSSWSSVGDGLSGSVTALAVFDDGLGGGPALYAGGFFETAGETTVNRIAQWDGTAWSPLGTGVSGSIPNVRALAVFDDGTGGGPAIYAGGFFETAGGVTVNNIAKWDGSSWSAVGSGFNGTVRALAVFDDGSGPALYAGGMFSATADGVPVNRVAKWNGTAWSALGSGMGGPVLALAVFDDGSGSGPMLHAGGVLGAPDDTPKGLARWDGTTWTALGNGITAVFDIAQVLALAVFDDGSGDGPALFVGGNITTADDVLANGIAKWNGSAWSSVANGMESGEVVPVVLALAVFDDNSGGRPGLYAGGFFESAGTVTANGIARWPGCPIKPLCAAADLNGDGVVAVFDLLQLLGAWGPCPGCPEDINGDNVVDVFDLLNLLSVWGPCDSQSTRERR